MYTNIDPSHAVEVMRALVPDYADEIPVCFPQEMFLRVLTIVLKRNIFQCGDTYWRQIVGTAMGTSTACKLATLYFGYHERTTIIPRYSPFLPYLSRFIDDKLGALGHGSAGSQEAFENFNRDMNNFGRLKWIVEELSDEVNFLDLTITIDPSSPHHHQNLRQAPQLHLYIPPSSAHPPGMLRGLVFGSLRRYWTQNSRIEDYQSIATKFAEQLNGKRLHTRRHRASLHGS